MEGGEIKVDGRDMQWCVTNTVELPSLRLSTKTFVAWTIDRQRSVHLQLATDTGALDNHVAERLVPIADQLELSLSDNTRLIVAKEWTSTFSSIYNSPPGVYTLFKYDAPSEFILRNRDGGRVTFSTNHLHVSKIQDPSGNTLSFFYDEQTDKLDYVVDTLGRAIDFSHDAQGRLEWIQDFRGRRVEYSYDSNGDLVGVRTPTVTSTGGFNDFTAGKTERYTYLSGHGNLLDHKLTAIIRPNDVTQPTPPYGDAFAQFAYDTSPTSVFFGWCTSETLGGTNAVGTAGGTIYYTHSVVDATTPLGDTNALKVGRIKATVTNRKGYATEYTANQNGHVIKVVEYEGSTPRTTVTDYNTDGEIIKVTQPRGNYTVVTYSTGIRHVAGNVASITDYTGGITSDQASRSESFAYEPIFNNLVSSTDYRGHVTQYFTDYQEGNTTGASNVIPAIQAELLGILSASAVTDLVSEYLYGQDLNEDGIENAARGHIVQVAHPVATINAVGGAPLALLEGSTLQGSYVTRTYNAYGQITSETNEEENVTVFLYWPATDPDGDGTATEPSGGLDTETGGYLMRKVEDTLLPYSHAQLAGVDARTGIGRNSGLGPAAAHKTTDFWYDPSGNVVASIDPRGVRHEYSVNELDEVWKQVRGTDVSAAAGRGGGIGGASEDLSGQKRIEVTLQKGTDLGHGERLATEQQLIKSIEKHLKDR